jgi:hypothetical protein
MAQTLEEQIESLERLANGNKQLTHKGKTVIRQDLAAIEARIQHLKRRLAGTRNNQTCIEVERL